MSIKCDKCTDYRNTCNWRTESNLGGRMAEGGLPRGGDVLSRTSKGEEKLSRWLEREVVQEEAEACVKAWRPKEGAGRCH